MKTPNNEFYSEDLLKLSYIERQVGVQHRITLPRGFAIPESREIYTFGRDFLYNGNPVSTAVIVGSGSELEPERGEPEIAQAHKVDEKGRFFAGKLLRSVFGDGTQQFHIRRGMSVRLSQVAAGRLALWLPPDYALANRLESALPYSAPTSTLVV
jgi:hypothetical protein